jgi:aryl-alcohol dehydrogenase-like predicted oxidoreductase
MLRLENLCLGTAQFGIPYGVANSTGRVSDDEIYKILKLARACGVTRIDTAAGYGESERNLGAIGVESFDVVTKLSAPVTGAFNAGQWVHDAVGESLERLNISHLYGVLLHRPKDLLGINGISIYKALQSLKTKGIISKFGISIYDADEYKELRNFEFDIIQFPLNPLDARLLCSDLVGEFRLKKIELQARSIFLQGLLLQRKDERKPYFQKWNSVWERWSRALERQGVSPLDACLSFAGQFEDVSGVIVGVNGFNQFQEIVEGVKNAKPFDYEYLRVDEELINPVNWLKFI